MKSHHPDVYRLMQPEEPSSIGAMSMRMCRPSYEASLPGHPRSSNLCCMQAIKLAYVYCLIFAYVDLRSGRWHPQLSIS